MATDAKEKQKTQEKPKGSILYSIFVFIIGIFAISYLTTGTFDFDGGVLKAKALYRKAFPQGEKVFTTKQLALYDGSDPNRPIYLAIKGRVYDVTAGANYYGKGGGYSFFAGKDATRAFITGCFQTHLTHDLRGITEEQMKSLNSWIEIYENSDKYFYVGRVEHAPIDPSTPIPPPCDE
ncbi:hypothetical protein HDV04_002462 [Boothiomyces sp. JEL0838]|nr:hypothetical protein HDV04_002462 [Boothiomyces sp. JEL0838]